MSDDYQRIELITGTARRRRWTTEQKLRIIEASCEPGESVSSVARRHGVARSHLHERVHRPAPPRGHFCKADEELLPLIRRVVDQRPTYGYRRVTALVNRVLTAEGKPASSVQTLSHI